MQSGVSSGRGSSGQSIGAKQAEVRMPPHGERLRDDVALGGVHRTRADEFICQFDWLERRGVRASPFLEIGAGTAQRSLALGNARPDAQGFATDINAASLRDATVIQRVFRFSRRPYLVVCDASHLPFADNTFAFAFAFQMLHRFTDPAPVVQEVHRVLARGGFFYFNDEPVGSRLRRALRGRRTLSNPPSATQRVAAVLGVEKVFWDDAGFDRAHRIEISRLTLPSWEYALEVFGPDVWLEVNRRLRLRLEGQPRVRDFFVRRFAGIIGGNLRGLCRKCAGAPVQDTRLVDRLICLDCGTSLEVAAALEGKASDVRCAACARVYPADEGIVRLLPRDLETALYG